MAFTSTTQQPCGKSVSMPLFLLAAALLAAPCEGGILTEVGGLSSFGIGVSEDSFHAAIAEEDCDAPALNMLHHKATYVKKKAKKEEVVVSHTNSENDDKSQSESSARHVKLPFFSQKTAKLPEGVVLAQSESRARSVKLPFFSQKTPKLAEGMVLAQSESRARTVTLPFFSQKTPKLEEVAQKPREMDVPHDMLAEALDDEQDVGVALFQTDMHYKPAHRKPAHMSSLAVGPDGSVSAATISGHATLPSEKMTMTFAADGSVF